VLNAARELRLCQGDIGICETQIGEDVSGTRSNPRVASPNAERLNHKIWKKNSWRSEQVPFRTCSESDTSLRREFHAACAVRHTSTAAPRAMLDLWNLARL
jgi:hypothetical protein